MMLGGVRRRQTVARAAMLLLSSSSPLPHIPFAARFPAAISPAAFPAPDPALAPAPAHAPAPNPASPAPPAPGCCVLLLLHVLSSFAANAPDRGDAVRQQLLAHCHNLLCGTRVAQHTGMAAEAGCTIRAKSARQGKEEHTLGCGAAVRRRQRCSPAVTFGLEKSTPKAPLIWISTKPGETSAPLPSISASTKDCWPPLEAVQNLRNDRQPVMGRARAGWEEGGGGSRLTDRGGR